MVSVPVPRISRTPPMAASTSITPVDVLTSVPSRISRLALVSATFSRVIVPAFWSPDCHSSTAWLKNPLLVPWIVRC